MLGTPRGLWERDSTPKGHTQSLTHSVAQGRSNDSREAWPRLPADLIDSRGGKEATAGPSGDTDTAGHPGGTDAAGHPGGTDAAGHPGGTESCG